MSAPTKLHMPNGIVYSGNTVATIIRRVWGPRAYFQRKADPNSPEVGMVLRTTKDPHVQEVCADVVYIEGDNAFADNMNEDD